MKTFKKVALSCSVIAMIPILFSAAFIWRVMWRSVGLRDGETCVRTFQPFQKGVYWEHGEWHHYVDFSVDVADPLNYPWRITEAPLPSSVWEKFSQANLLRVTYRWPDDWKDPYPLERWEICLLEN